MARNEKLTDELQEKLCNYVRGGHYLETSAAACGVAASTFHLWMKKGREAKGGKYRAFHDEVKAAEAASELLLVDQILKEGGARGKLQILKRRFRERWGDKVTAEHTGPGGAPLETGPAVTVMISGADAVWNHDTSPVEMATEDDTAGEDDL